MFSGHRCLSPNAEAAGFVIYIVLHDRVEFCLAERSAFIFCVDCMRPGPFRGRDPAGSAAAQVAVFSSDIAGHKMQAWQNRPNRISRTS
jgi:hypothetical protein